MVVPDNLFNEDCDESLFRENYNVGEGGYNISRKSFVESFFSCILPRTSSLGSSTRSPLAGESSITPPATKSWVTNTRHKSSMEGRRCRTPGCYNPAKLQYPACIKLNIQGSLFCLQACFRDN